MNDYNADTCICQVCGKEVAEAEWIEDTGNVCAKCLSSTTPMLRGNITDAIAAMKFMFAGNAYFTIVSKATGTRFTYRVGKPKAARTSDTPWFYVSLLNGPDNTANYTWLGTICSTGNFKRASKPMTPSMDAPSMKAFLWLWDKLKAGHLPSNIEFWHEGRCGRCGRMLTVPEYKVDGVVVAGVAVGIGPECAGRL